MLLVRHARVMGLQRKQLNIVYYHEFRLLRSDEPADQINNFLQL